MKWLGWLLLLCAVVIAPRSAAATPHGLVACTDSQGHVQRHFSTDGVARCSTSFYFSGTCAAHDTLAVFSGPYAVKGSEWSGVRAWESQPISIVGAAIAFISPIGGFQYAFAGNNYDSDEILWAKDGVGATTVFFPSGWSMDFPRAGRFKASFAHLDVHVGCTSGSFEGFLTIYYQINPD